MLGELNRFNRNRQRGRAIPLLPLNQRIIVVDDDNDVPAPTPRFFARVRFILRNSFIAKVFVIFMILLLIALGIMIHFTLYASHDLDASSSTRNFPTTVRDTWDFEDIAAAYVATDESPTLPRASQVCRSEACQNAAISLLDNMDLKVNPCDNLYKFVCGKTEISRISTVSEDLQSKKQNIMKSLDTSIKKYGSQYVHKLRNYYDSCVNEFLINVTDVIDKFDEVGGWPIMYPNKTYEEKDLQWPRLLTKFYQVGLPAKFLIDFLFQIDLSNRTKVTLILSAPDFYMSPDGLRAGIDDAYVKSYMKFMTNVLKVFDIRNVDDEIREVIKFEVELAKTVRVFEEYETSTISVLQTVYPRIPWLEMINGILSPHAQINASTEIQFASPFLEQFYHLMTRYRPSNRAIANFIFWRAVVEIGPGQLMNELNKKLLKMKYVNGEKNKAAREKICTDLMNSDMNIAVSSLFIRDGFDDQNVAAIKIMSENIRQHLYRMIEKVEWLSDNVKNEFLNKILKMDVLIGYPDEFRDEKIIEEYYKDLDISSEKFFINNLNYQKFQWKNKIEEYLRGRSNKDWRGLFGNVLEILSQYTGQNAIYVSGGILHPLLFDHRIPNYINYGIMGETMGHEMSHALSYRFMYFNASGNLDYSWWDLESIDNFSKKTQCLIDLYNSYTYKEYNLSVNGKLTLDENVADITGLKLAYDAYNYFMRDKPIEPRLPGLEKYTSKQMFWIAHAATFCEHEVTKEDLELLMATDIHTPDEYRVIGSVATLPEFFEDFECEPENNMQLVENCSMWF